MKRTNPLKPLLMANFPHVVGGGEVGLEMLARDLATLGHQPIITVPGHSDLFPGLDRRTISSSVPEGSLDLRGLAAESDLIHCFSIRSMLMATLAGTGKPVILHVLIPNPDLFDQVLARFARMIICNSEATARRFYGFAKTTVIYNGVRKPRPPRTPPLLQDPNRLTIGLFGPASPRKGQMDALPAIQEVLSKRLDVDVAFAGNMQGPIGLRLREVAAQSKGRIRVLGFVPDLAEHMAEFALVLVPSRSEGFGRVAVEAMRAGVPVLANRVEGLIEALRDLQEPWLPADPGLWAKRILRELEQPSNTPDQLRQAAARFAPQKYVENILACYRRVLEKE